MHSNYLQPSLQCKEDDLNTQSSQPGQGGQQLKPVWPQRPAYSQSDFSTSYPSESPRETLDFSLNDDSVSSNMFDVGASMPQFGSQSMIYDEQSQLTPVTQKLWSPKVTPYMRRTGDFSAMDPFPLDSGLSSASIPRRPRQPPTKPEREPEYEKEFIIDKSLQGKDFFLQHNMNIRNIVIQQYEQQRAYIPGQNLEDPDPENPYLEFSKVLAKRGISGEMDKSDFWIMKAIPDDSPGCNGEYNSELGMNIMPKPKVPKKPPPKPSDYGLFTGCFDTKLDTPVVDADLKMTYGLSADMSGFSGDYCRLPVFRQGGFLWGKPFLVTSEEEYRNRHEEIHSTSVCIHREMSIDGQLKEISYLMQNMGDFVQDPFFPDKVLQMKDRQILSRFIMEFKSNLTYLVCRQLTDHLQFMEKLSKETEQIAIVSLHVSEITLAHDADKNDDIVEALLDNRCVSLGSANNLKKMAGYHEQKVAIFPTPNFHAHFDFKHVKDRQLLDLLANYMCITLGFNIHVQTTGSKDVQSFEWEPTQLFCCVVGHGNWYNRNFIAYPWQQQTSPYTPTASPWEKEGHEPLTQQQEAMLQARIAKPAQQWGHCYNPQNPLNVQNRFYKPCQFYLRYRRIDPYDENSRYLLVEYDMNHTHPLDMRISSPYTYTQSLKSCHFL